jgi:hypothetical protein
MSQILLTQAVEAFARAGVKYSDAKLENEWKWGDYEEGVRFAFFLTYQELREVAAQTAVQRAIDGPTMTWAQRILVQHHAAYRDLCGILVSVSEDELDRVPVPGEWPLRVVLGHVIDAEQGFLGVIRYALERHRSGDGRPLEMPEEDDVEDEVDNSVGTLEQILTNYDTLHFQVLHELASISDDELRMPSFFWEDNPMEIRFRLHRFDAHLRQHTIQVEKTLAGIDRHPREAERLVRMLYGALGEAEGAVIGAPEMGTEQWRKAAEGIHKRAAEIAKA